MLLELWVLWLAPLISGLLSPLVERYKKKSSSYVSIFSQLIVLIFFTILVGKYIYGEIPMKNLSRIHKVYVERYSLLKINSFSLDFGFILDGLSLVMLGILVFISFFVFLYSFDYMEEDLGRYWFWMNIFVFSMTLLILSSNLIQMLFFWEMVGICSWMLISFWYKKKEYVKYCGLKAFLTTFFSDIIFIVGISLLTISLLSSGIDTPDIIKISINSKWTRSSLAFLAMILMIFGPLGKSSQFPFNDWLPEAMVAPSTVSALLHSATMVKAGVYFLARIFLVSYDVSLLGGDTSVFSPFFYISVYFGIFTAILSGLYAMASRNLKKILAFSTIGHLAIIFFILGYSGLTKNPYLFSAGVGYILSHAIYKSLLFLSAGSIIKIEGTEDIKKLRIPVKDYEIAIPFLIGFLSLMGFPFLGEFWEEHIAISSISTNTLFYFFFVISSVLTVMYSARVLKNVLSLKGKRERKVPKFMLISKLFLSLFSILSLLLFILSLDFLDMFGKEELNEIIGKIFSPRATFFSISFIILGLLIFEVFYSIEPNLERMRISKYLKMSLEKRIILNPLYNAVPKFFLFLSNLSRRIQTGDIRFNSLYVFLSIIFIFLLLMVMFP